MDKELLLKILQLDSIIEKLTWQERMKIHFCVQGQELLLKPTTLLIYDWVSHWESPLMKIGQDRLKYCYDSSIKLWFPIEEYREITPKIKEIIKIIEQ